MFALGFCPGSEPLLDAASPFKAGKPTSHVILYLPGHCITELRAQAQLQCTMGSQKYGIRTNAVIPTLLRAPGVVALRVDEFFRCIHRNSVKNSAYSHTRERSLLANCMAEAVAAVRGSGRRQHTHCRARRAKCNLIRQA